MAEQYIHSMRNEAIKMYVEHGLFEKAKKLSKEDIHSPVMRPPNIHAEDESTNKDINLTFKELSYDLSIINVELSNAAYLYSNLLFNTKNKLNQIEEELVSLVNKRKDIEMFDCTDAMTLSPNDFYGEFSAINDAVCAKIVNEKKTKYEIISITGNGYEGNKHVESNNVFLDSIIQTDDIIAINDGKDDTLYEYSRINAEHRESNLFPLINIGTVEAKCCITIHAKEEINLLKILATGNDVMLTAVEGSKDGINFKSHLKKPIPINNSIGNDINANYIKNSGLISFPHSEYVKIYLRSNGYTDEKIIYSLVEFQESEDNRKWKYIKQESEIKTDHSFTIELDKEIKEKDNFSVEIINNDKKVKNSVSLSRGNKAMIITPLEPYKKSETYVLKVLINNQPYYKIVFATILDKRKR